MVFGKAQQTAQSTGENAARCANLDAHIINLGKSAVLQFAYSGSISERDKIIIKYIPLLKVISANEDAENYFYKPHG